MLIRDRARQPDLSHAPHDSRRSAHVGQRLDKGSIFQRLDPRQGYILRLNHPPPSGPVSETPPTGSFRASIGQIRASALIGVFAYTWAIMHYEAHQSVINDLEARILTIRDSL